VSIIGRMLLSLTVVAALGGCKGGGFDIKNVNLDNVVKSAANLREVKEPEEIQIGQGMTETLLGARPLYDDKELQRYVNQVGLWVAVRTPESALAFWRD
jgi:predicted Zn-dependent protease